MRQSIVKLIHKYGPPRLIPIIEQNSKESLLLRTKKVADDQIPIGKTMIGGRPDLPEHIDWPIWKELPLSFVAQINLIDLPKQKFLNILPSKGVLSFFFSWNSETWAFDPKNKDSWKVFYFDEQKLQRRDYPPNFPDEGRFASCAVEFQNTVTIPELESPYIKYDFSKALKGEVDQWVELREHLR